MPRASYNTRASYNIQYEARGNAVLFVWAHLPRWRFCQMFCARRYGRVTNFGISVPSRFSNKQEPALCMCLGSWTQSCGKHHLIQDVRPPILSLFERACFQVAKRGCGTTGCTGKRPTEDSDLLANRKDHGGGYALSSINGNANKSYWCGTQR